MSANAVAAVGAVGTFVIAMIVAVVAAFRAMLTRMDQMEARLTNAIKDSRTELRTEFTGAIDKVWLVLDDMRGRLARLEERVKMLLPGSREPTTSDTPPAQEPPAVLPPLSPEP